MNQNILGRNNVKVFGNGAKCLILAHGFGCDQNMWRYITPAFEEDYQIILFDYVGSGKSDLGAYSSIRYGSLDGYVQDVLEICEALQIENGIFVGHSVSSIIGILAAIKEPNRFNRLILVGPSPCYINTPPDYRGGFERSEIAELLHLMEKNYLGWANFLAPAIMQNPNRPELTRELQESFCATDPIIARQFAEVTFFSDNRSDLIKLQRPSLIMQCSEDMIAPLEVGNYLHRHLFENTLRIMKATGHCPHLSHPDETIEIIKEYLNSSQLQ